jgi:ribosomal protein S18 acetylase RimI-like enzyme
MAVNHLDYIKENLLSAVRMLGRNPAGDLLELPSGTVAGSTGLPYAGENYALFSSAATAGDISLVFDFFKRMQIPFIVPQVNESSDKIYARLASYGFKPYHTYTAMSINTGSANDPRDADVVEVSGLVDTRKWADASWAGFTGEQPAPDNFRRLAEYMSDCNENSLFYLNFDGKPVCSGLLHKSMNTYGLYYFATHPGFRRLGLARRLMVHMLWRASFSAEKTVLLATESGYPMYLGFGFVTEAQIPILSVSDDI